MLPRPYTAGALTHAAHLLLTAPRRSVRGGFWLAAWNALKRSLTALCFPACCVPAYGGHLEVHLPLLSMFGFVHQAAGRGRSASESSGVFRNSGSQLGMLCVFGLLHFASRPALYRRTEDISYYTLRCFRCFAFYTRPLDVSDQLRSLAVSSGNLARSLECFVSLAYCTLPPGLLCTGVRRTSRTTPCAAFDVWLCTPGRWTCPISFGVSRRLQGRCTPLGAPPQMWTTP